LDALQAKFNADDNSKKDLVEYAEPNGRNKAIHFAVLSGSIIIIDFVLKVMKANASELTGNGLNVLHCGA